MKDYYYIKVAAQNSFDYQGYYSCFYNITQTPDLIKYYDDLDRVVEDMQLLKAKGYTVSVKRL